MREYVKLVPPGIYAQGLQSTLEKYCNLVYFAAVSCTYTATILGNFFPQSEKFSVVTPPSLVP